MVERFERQQKNCRRNEKYVLVKQNDEKQREKEKLLKIKKQARNSQNSWEDFLRFFVTLKQDFKA